MSTITTRTGLHRIVYASRFGPSFPVSITDQDREIDAIVGSAVRHNKPAQVTGLLLIHQGQFLQALEGPAEAVMTIYGRILNDPRHERATVISAGPAPERRFGDWTMCARRASRADEAIMNTLDLKGALALDKLSPGQALTLLAAIGDVQRRVAKTGA